MLNCTVCLFLSFIHSFIHSRSMCAEAKANCQIEQIAGAGAVVGWLVGGDGGDGGGGSGDG